MSESATLPAIIVQTGAFGRIFEPDQAHNGRKQYISTGIAQ
jgi:hypothetical protein